MTIDEMSMTMMRLLELCVLVCLKQDGYIETMMRRKKNRFKNDDQAAFLINIFMKT